VCKAFRLFFSPPCFFADAPGCFIEIDGEICYFYWNCPEKRFSGGFIVQVWV